MLDGFAQGSQVSLGVGVMVGEMQMLDYLVTVGKIVTERRIVGDAAEQDYLMGIDIAAVGLLEDRRRAVESTLPAFLPARETEGRVAMQVSGS